MSHTTARSCATRISWQLNSSQRDRLCPRYNTAKSVGDKPKGFGAWEEKRSSAVLTFLWHFLSRSLGFGTTASAGRGIPNR